MADRKRNTGRSKEMIPEETHGEKSLGFVRIADDVVSSIAMIAAHEVDGVADGKSQTGSSKVKVTGRNVDILMNIVISYGHNIPETCGQVQTRVRTAVENMTGLNVRNVNIRIVGAEIQAG